MLTVPQVINIAKASLYLSALDVQKGYLYSPRVIPESTKMIYMELKALEWAYNSTLHVENQEIVGINYHLTLAGVPNAGDVVSIYMKDNLGNNETFTYTVAQGDTILDIYQELEPLILASPLFNATIVFQPLYLLIDSDSGVDPVSGVTSVILNSNLSITQTANYVYSICRGYNLEAKNIVSGGGGTFAIYKQENLISNYDLYLTGIPNIGDQVVVVVEDSLSTLNTFTYTAVSGDTALSVMNNLIALINASVDFNAFYTNGVHPYISIQSNYGLITVNGFSSINYAF